MVTLHWLSSCILPSWDPCLFTITATELINSTCHTTNLLSQNPKMWLSSKSKFILVIWCLIFRYTNIQHGCGSMSCQRFMWWNVDLWNIMLCVRWVKVTHIFLLIVLCKFCILKLLWPNDTIWQHRSGSTLVQITACYWCQAIKGADVAGIFEISIPKVCVWNLHILNDSHISQGAMSPCLFNM